MFYDYAGLSYNDLLFPNFLKFLFPTRNFTMFLLKMDLNRYQKTTFALNMWSNLYEFHTEDAFFGQKPRFSS